MGFIGIKSKKEACEELEKIPDYHSANKEVISSHAKKFLPSMVNKYNNLVNIDNVHAAQKKADDVIIMMGTNIKNMVDNMENLEVFFFS